MNKESSKPNDITLFNADIDINRMREFMELSKINTDVPLITYHGSTSQDIKNALHKFIVKRED